MKRERERIVWTEERKFRAMPNKPHMCVLIVSTSKSSHQERQNSLRMSEGLILCMPSLSQCGLFEVLSIVERQLQIAVAERLAKRLCQILFPQSKRS